MKNTTRFLILLLLLPTLLRAQSIDGNGGSLDATFSNPADLTDQQYHDAKNFTHEGIKERRIKEGCAKANDCKDEEGLPLEMMIGKAYAMIGMFTSSGGGLAPTMTSKAVNAETGKNESQSDYCMMAAMGWETIGGMIQQHLQKKSESSASNIQDVQLQSLVNLKETHKARAKTASWQRTAYAAISACYVAQLFNGAAADWKYMLKLGGATTLTVLYQRKVNKHKKAAGVVQEVIDSLPKTGECNPWTGTTCFCSEKSSRERYPNEYQEVCVLNKGNFETPRIALGCGAVVNGKVQYDKECKCKKTNTCMKSTLAAYNPKFPFGQNLMNEANKTLNLLNSGEFDQAKIDNASTSTAALAAKVKPNFKGKYPEPKLTAEQKKIAEGLGSVLPPPLARIAAASNGNYQGGIKDGPMLGTSAISKLSPQMKEKLATAISGRYKKGGGTTTSKLDEPEFSFPKFPGQEPEQPAGGTEVLSFAEQALSKADVSNAPSTPIFDIISNRYRRSGWKKLETETVEK
ncbi:MAG: hypothetical protein ACLGHN_03380 [Bacteriovoracia bacterium]